MHLLLQFRHGPFISFWFTCLLFSARSLSESLLAFYRLLNLLQLDFPSPVGLFSQKVTRDLRIAKSRGHFSVSISSDLPVAPDPVSLNFLTPLVSKTQPVPALAQPVCIFLFVLQQGLLFPHPLFKCWCVSCFCLLVSCVTSDEFRFCPPRFLHK